MPRMLTIAELRKEIVRREKMLAKVYVKRDRVAAKLAALDHKVIALGGEPLPPVGRQGGLAGASKVGRKRVARRGDDALVAYVKKALAKSRGGMRVKDVAEAVKKAGYKSDAKNFYGLVAVALRGKDFRRPGRGVYVLRDRTAAGRKKPRKAGRKPSEQHVQPAQAAAQQATGG